MLTPDCCYLLSCFKNKANDAVNCDHLSLIALQINKMKFQCRLMTKLGFKSLTCTHNHCSDSSKQVT